MKKKIYIKYKLHKKTYLTVLGTLFEINYAKQTF